MALILRHRTRRGCIKAKNKGGVTDTLLQCRLLVYDTVQPHGRHGNKSHTKIFRNGRDDHKIREYAGLARSSLFKIRRKIVKSERQRSSDASSSSLHYSILRERIKKNTKLTSVFNRHL